tara:strand:- start:5620 stop:7956 length:2337 start_codon:yes stop_codon:yes gene_type:complete
MAKTKIGTKLIANSAVTTAKLNTSAITRDKIASGSVQVGHLDLFQARNDIAHIEDADVLVVSASKGKDGGMRTITFAHLKAAVSASDSAAGDTGAVQFHQGPSNALGGISKIRTDGVHLTASDGGKVVFAFTGISGSTAAMSASTKTAFRLDTKTTLELAINGANELILNASRLAPEVSNGLDLGSSSKLFNNIYGTQVSGTTVQAHTVDADKATLNDIDATTVSGSGTSQFHKVDVDEGTFNRAIATVVSGTTVQAHTVDADKATIGDLDVTTVSGSGTSQFHKVDVDEGTFNRAIATVVSGTTVQAHTVDADKGTIGDLDVVSLSGSSTAELHKLDVDEGTFNKVVVTNITSSGTTQLHNTSVSTLTGAVGNFHKVTVDKLEARTYKSSVTTSEHFEIVNKQIIAAVSQSAGPAVEGAGLQIGGTAGSGSSGIASVILGDAGGGAGKDLLFNLGSTQGASLSTNGGRKNDAVLFGVSGTLSASIAVFQEIIVNHDLNAPNFSGSTGTFHTLSGTLLTAFDVNADRANVNDLDGTSATFTTVSGTTVQSHTVDADKVTVQDLDGTTATFTTVSGTTVQAHTVDADKGTIGDLDVTTISGSGTSILHQLQSDVLSGSKLEGHVADFDKLTVNQYTGNDTIKAASLNRDIVYDIDNGHGGLSFANGVLSVGTRRQVFSRDTAVANSNNLSAGSGSLFTTASLANDAAGNPTIILSGSEMVYLNGVLLVKAPLNQRPPVDGDYNIDYNSANGVCTVELHESLSMDSDDILIVSYLSGTIS